MAAAIQAGQNVHVKVVKPPATHGATKTIIRLLSKDKAAMREAARQRRIRKVGYAPQPRGGRLYGGFVVKQHPVKGVVGESGTIFASLDVVRDLASVAKFVEVTPA
jgi:hypothetical protein